MDETKQNKGLRHQLRTSCILVLICCFTIACTQKTETDSPLDGAAQDDRSLRAGAARIEVTQWASTPEIPQTHDHQRTFVRAIVIDNGVTRAALISVPGSSFDWPDISEKVSAELDIPYTQILVSATHSHSYRAVDQEINPLTQAVIEAVQQAKDRLQPALMGFGTGEAHLNVNRDYMNSATNSWEQSSNANGPSDKTVYVLSFVSPSGKPIAVQATYAMHPVNAYALNTTSGDFPEAMSRHVEKAFNDEVIASFALGAAGDQNPLYLRPSTNAMASRSGNKITGFEMYREDSEGPLRVRDENGDLVITAPADPDVLNELFDFIEAEGQVLGEEVIRVMSSDLRMLDQVQIAGYAAKPVCPARTRINGDKLDPNTRQGMAAVYEDAQPVAVPVGLLAIGTVGIGVIGEEPYSMIAQKVMDKAPLSNTFVMSFTNEKGHTGYIPDDASFHHQTFQVLNSSLKPGCAESAIVDAIVGLEREYLKTR